MNTALRIGKTTSFGSSKCILCCVKCKSMQRIFHCIRTVIVLCILPAIAGTTQSQHPYGLLPSSPPLPVPTGPPQGLAVARRTSTSITLTWRDPAPDRINDRDGVTGFVVRRNGQRVATVTGLTYTFTGLGVATSYNFEVLAINEQGIAPNNHAAQLTASTASGGT